MEHKPQGQQLDPRLQAEDPNKVGLRLLLYTQTHPHMQWQLYHGFTGGIDRHP